MKPNTNLEAIFSEAIELSDPARRGAYLDEVCAGDVQLRNRVRRLVDASQRADSFMDEPATIMRFPNDARELSHDGPALDALSQFVGEQPGDAVGRYRLLECVGEGGMGQVFKAEQSEPIQRTVALKLIKPGLDTNEVLARFETERQALAVMDSPHIAKVLDAGATDKRRPFFAMEWVDGQAITDFCNAERLTTRQRLELFVKVCRAIQHAHQKGIIHRDIKPSNVLVANSSGGHQQDAEPKVIDFGIAKAICADSDESPVTRIGELVGTPAYMSPEQATLEEDVDTRSDVYSLGALLYELLVGIPPFGHDQLKPLTRDEMRRVIREETPNHPSMALRSLSNAQRRSDGEQQAQIATVRNQGKTVAHTVATARRSTPQKLSSQLRGELDWIVMRSLEKDRDRRYSTAASFADDVERYLKNEPVVARPPTYLYRLQKFAARNKLAIAALSTIAATVLIATGITAKALHSAWLSMSREASEKRVLAQHVEFVNEGLFAQANPLSEPNREIKLRTVLDRASQSLSRQRFEQPKVEATIRITLGRAYYGLGEYAQALTHFKRASEIRKEVLGPSDGESIAAHVEYVQTLLASGQIEVAEIELYRLKVIAEPVLEENDQLMQAIRELEASCLESSGDHAQAEALLRDQLALHLATVGEDHVATHRAKSKLAFVLQSQQQYDEALELLSEAHSGLLEANFRWDPVALRVTSNLATLHVARQEMQRAKSIYGATIPKLERALGPEHPQTLTAKHGLALVNFSEGNLQVAAASLSDVLKRQREHLGTAHPSTLTTIHNLALARKALGQAKDAEELLTEELDARLEHFGIQHDSTRETLSSLAFHHLEQSEFVKAIQRYQQLVGKPDPNFVDHDMSSVVALTMLGFCQLKAKETVDASTSLERAQSAIDQLQPEHWLSNVVSSLRGEAYWKLDRRAEAEEALLQGYDGLKARHAEIPQRWQPMGLRAATRRLAEFYESADSDETRKQAAQYRIEQRELRASNLRQTETQVGVRERFRNNQDGNTD